MTDVQENIGFTWDEWESEFRGVVDKMTDEEWGNLDDNLTRMEEQEEGIFAEIKKHSDDIGSQMTNDKSKIVEVIVVENKTVNRPNDKDNSVMGVGNGRGTNQFHENKVDQVADNKVNNDDMSESDCKMSVMDMLRIIKKRVEEMGELINKWFDEREEKWDKHLDKMDKLIEKMGECRTDTLQIGARNCGAFLTRLTSPETL